MDWSVRCQTCVAAFSEGCCSGRRDHPATHTSLLPRTDDDRMGSGSRDCGFGSTSHGPRSHRRDRKARKTRILSTVITHTCSAEGPCGRLLFANGNRTAGLCWSHCGCLSRQRRSSTSLKSSLPLTSFHDISRHLGRCMEDAAMQVAAWRSHHRQHRS